MVVLSRLGFRLLPQTKTCLKSLYSSPVSCNSFTTLCNSNALKPNTQLCRKFLSSSPGVPRSRAKLVPFNNGQHIGGSPKSGLIKPLIFTVSFTLGSFIGVSIWEYENFRSRAKKAVNFPFLKNDFHSKKSELRKDLEHQWHRLSPGEKFFLPIAIANIVVFGLWRIPRLQPFMMKYFCSNPAARIVCWPMVLSTFSHYSLFHIFANMYVLYSFSNIAVAALGKEQLLGMYLSAGVVSTFASYIYKVGTLQAGYSLGASGAIMAILALVCTSYPDTRLSILFVPGFTFSAGNAIKVIMGIDLLGCILRWRFLDHAAHLGGALFGLFWHYIGSPLMWPTRDQVHKFWHRIRGHKS